MSIGKNIKTARNHAGLTQTELARLTNLSRSYIGDIEHDRYNPSISTLIIISAAIHQPLNLLLDSTSTENPADLTKFLEQVNITYDGKLITDDDRMKIRAVLHCTKRRSE